MGKCRNCHVEILDETESCPLCRSILEQTDALEDMYPDVRVRMRRLHLAARIYLFCAILAEFVMVTVNLLTNTQIWWSLIAGVGLLYVYLVMRYALLGTAGHKGKVTVLVLLLILIAVTIDFALGYRGWSVDFVLPVGIVAVDLFILICMIVNHRNWQSYLMWQLLMVLCSLLPVGLYIRQLERYAVIAFLPLAVSVLSFLGVLIIGDRRARTELRRRFHF